MTHLLAAVVTLAVTGRANATPSIAALNQFVAVAWGATGSGTGTDVYTAVSRDGGRTFLAPVRVNDGDGKASLSLEQPPRVSLVARPGSDPSIVIVWTAKTKDGTRLLFARSENGGASFGRAAAVAGSEAPGNRGWESTAVDRSGHVIALWLDHREMASHTGSSSAHEEHNHASTPNGDAAAHAQASKLYFARLDDGASARQITGGVCYCCKTATAVGSDGSIFVAWRHVYPGSVRDIAFSVSHDGGSSFSGPIRVSDDRWALNGCPENGPAVAAEAGKVVHVLWPTLLPPATADAEPTLALFHAVTRDNRAFSPRERVVTEGTPRHPQIVATSQGVAATWDEELDGGARRVVFVRALSSGAREVLSSARAQTPSLGATSSGIVIAWTEGSDQSVIRVAQR
jgi:hypothetical protein